MQQQQQDTRHPDPRAPSDEAHGYPRSRCRPLKRRRRCCRLLVSALIRTLNDRATLSRTLGVQWFELVVKWEDDVRGELLEAQRWLFPGGQSARKQQQKQPASQQALLRTAKKRCEKFKSLLRPWPREALPHSLSCLSLFLWFSTLPRRKRPMEKVRMRVSKTELEREAYTAEQVFGSALPRTQRSSPHRSVRPPPTQHTSPTLTHHSPDW